MLAANAFCEFASQTESLQTGAVERRQMAVGTRCCGLPVLLFLQRGEQGASQQEGGEDEERLGSSFFTKMAKAEAASMMSNQ